MKNGDTAALEWFIERYTGYAAAVVTNITGPQRVSDAEEIVADTFFALWQNAWRIKGSAVKSYIARIARNKALDFIRGAGEENLPLEEDVLELAVAGPEDAYAAAADRFAVQEAVLAMSHPQREIFIRHYFYFQKVAEISEAMGIPENTVKTHLRRGREKLRRMLEGEICV